MRDSDRDRPFWPVVSMGRSGLEEPGLALVVLSVVEQRLDAVRAVLAGAEVVEVAASIGMSRSTVHRWTARYLVEGLAGLADRSHRPRSSPLQVAPEVEARVAEMRRAHPRWGSTRIRLELLKATEPMAGMVMPSERTIDRILHRQGLLRSRPRKRPRESYRRWERPGPMQLWAVDIVGGVMLVDPRTGVLREGKVVTGVDDHSRYCVMAAVVERATSRAVCLALATALSRYGVPGEILSDNGKQFTDRFGKGGEVLFDKICRKNGIMHRLTAPASPNQNGKVERFHGTFRPEFLDTAGPFESVEQAQAAVDAWVRQYNHDRPHQGLNEAVPVTPAQRFTPTGQPERELLPLWLPPTIEPTSAVAASAVTPAAAAVEVLPPAAAPEPASVQAWTGGWPGAVEFDRVVPSSGNMFLAGRQIWLGPARAGLTVRFWADCDLIHLLIGGGRSRPCAPTCRSMTWPGWSPGVPSPPGRNRCPGSRTGTLSRSSAASPATGGSAWPDVPCRRPRSWPDGSSGSGSSPPP